MARSFTFNNEILLYDNQYELYYQYGDYNPLGLPPYTLRLKFRDNITPTPKYKGNFTQVSVSPNIWDMYYTGSWNNLLHDQLDLLEVLGANSTDVTTMSTLFQGCTALSSITLFDTSKVTAMDRMFRDCPITTVPLYDTSVVTDMTLTFASCTALTSVPQFDTYSVNKMNGTFEYCSALTTVPMFDTINVTSMYDMFANSPNLTGVPTFNTVNVTSMRDMFASCSGLKSVPLFNTTNVKEMDYMCYNCVNVTGGALALYQQASTQATGLTSHNDTFLDCGVNTVQGAAELAQIPSDWK